MCFRCDHKPVDFKPPQWTMGQMKAAISPELFERSTTKALLYTVRDLVIVAGFGYGAYKLDASLDTDSKALTLANSRYLIARVALWLTYFWFQSLALLGVWVLGHECGHGSFSTSQPLCDFVGFFLHSFVGTPYFSWKHSHALHHMYHAHMDKDQHMIPETRKSSEPKESSDTPGVSIEEIIEDTPIYVLFRLVVAQLIGFQMYLLFNTSGQPRYPRWTSHANPKSIIFQEKHWPEIMASNAGILGVIWGLHYASTFIGWSAVAKLYIAPWFVMSHWIAMIVYLQHSDPVLPHYRAGEWTYIRGALATMDRDFLGWQGKFFLHSIAHDHLVHHFFPRLPFYHAEKATEQLRAVLGPDYNYCESGVFPALWRNFNFCQYVDEEGDILFFRNKHGKSKRRYIPQAPNTDGIAAEKTK
ncbi:fatty acid desaturase-domain-containing protein [Infundibulicybe gibba]|nr:fatty acid desaturase-domain-containing protein [Infundibulicybe gibba]